MRLDSGARGNARCDVENGRKSSRTSVAKVERPQARVHNRIAGRILERAHQFTRGKIVSVDRAVAEISDEQRILQITEARRRDRHSPGRIQLAARYQRLQQIAVEIENIYVAVAGAGYVRIFRRVLLRVRHIKLSPEVLDIERCEAGGDRWISEAARQRGLGEIRVVNIDRPVTEIRSIQIAGRAVGCDRTSLVDRAAGRVIYFDDGARGIAEAAGPGRDAPILSIEDEAGIHSRRYRKHVRR